MNNQDWKNSNEILTKEFIFEDFVRAVQFLNKVADLAEQEKHHPDICIYSYNKVKISLTTHDEGNRITDKDIRLANFINRVA